jgi:hypothetical protein
MITSFMHSLQTERLYIDLRIPAQQFLCKNLLSHLGEIRGCEFYSHASPVRRILSESNSE